MPQFIPSDVRVVQGNTGFGAGLFAPLLEKGLQGLFPSAQDELFRAQASHFKTVDQMAQMELLPQHQFEYNSIQDPAGRAAYAKARGLDEALLASPTVDARRAGQIQGNLDTMSGGPMTQGRQPQASPQPGQPPQGGASPPNPGQSDQGQGIPPATADGVTAGQPRISTNPDSASAELAPFEGIQQLPKFGPQAVGAPGFQPPSVKQYSGPEDVVWSIYPRGNDAEQMQLRGWQDTLPIAQQTKQLMMTQGYFQKWLKGENPDPIDMSQFVQTTKMFEDQLINETAKRGELDPFSLSAAQNPKTVMDGMIMFQAATAEGREYLKAKGITEQQINEASQNETLLSMPPAARNNLFKNYILPRNVLGIEAMAQHVDIKTKMGNIDYQNAQKAFVEAQAGYIAGPQTRNMDAQTGFTEQQTSQLAQVMSFLPEQMKDSHLKSAAELNLLTKQTDALTKEIAARPGLQRLGFLLEMNKSRLAARTEMFNTYLGAYAKLAGGSGGGGTSGGGAQNNAVTQATRRIDTYINADAQLAKSEVEAIKEIKSAEMMNGGPLPPSDQAMISLASIRASRIAAQRAVAQDQKETFQATGVDPVANLRDIMTAYQESVGGELDAQSDFNLMLANSVQDDGRIVFPKWPGSGEMITDGNQWKVAKLAGDAVAASREFHVAKYGKPLPYTEWVTTPMVASSPVTPGMAFPTEADRRYYYNNQYDVAGTAPGPGGAVPSPSPQGAMRSGLSGSIFSDYTPPKKPSAQAPQPGANKTPSQRVPDLPNLRSSDKAQGPQAQGSSLVIMPDDEFIQASSTPSFGTNDMLDLLRKGYVRRIDATAPGEGNIFLFNEYKDPTIRVVIGDKAPVFTLSGILKSYPTVEALRKAGDSNPLLRRAIAGLASTPEGRAAFEKMEGARRDKAKKSQTPAPTKTPRNDFDPNSPRF